ncbi:MAG: class I SAM-dependent methyltransferase family protein [Candidatus Methanomethylophilaceae archaeon]|nr:class I SAM-dependent methyltransferase family protein [Candidatus Methanomethylophilaceae archaeon]
MVKCIRVLKKDGEPVRSKLISLGLLDLSFRIRSDGDHILLPVVCDSFEDYEIIDEELEVQKHMETDYRELIEVPSELKEKLPNSYDVIGDVALIKLEDELLSYKGQIGKALMAVIPSLRTVMLDSGVKGEFRIRDLEQIAGTGTSETIHKEFGTRMLTDPAKVYFNPRLATERERITLEVKSGETIIDMFAGVAPFGMVICKHAYPKIMYSIDLNPEAEYFAKRNVEMNHITNLVIITGDAKEAVKDLPQADRIIMNLPQMADQFLQYALEKAKVGATIHLHKIIERSDFDDFVKELVSKMKGFGYDMHIARTSELKTYSPTMSVYVLDIVRD